MLQCNLRQFISSELSKQSLFPSQNASCSIQLRSSHPNWPFGQLSHFDLYSSDKSRQCVTLSHCWLPWIHWPCVRLRHANIPLGQARFTEKEKKEEITSKLCPFVNRTKIETTSHLKVYLAEKHRQWNLETILSLIKVIKQKLIWESKTLKFILKDSFTS